MNFTIRKKIFALAFLSSLVPIVLISTFILIQQNDVSKKTSKLLLEDANNGLGKSAKSIYDMLNESNIRINQQLITGLKIADEIIANSGNFQVSKNNLTWKATNQFTKTSSDIVLPQINLGSIPINQVKTFDIKVPLVDKASGIAGASFTIFQRMNEAGDMLRIATNVKASNGDRAIGTYIPAIMPDGKPNPVIKKVLLGETFSGNAFVVNAWYMTAYQPIKDASGTIIGMLFNGKKQEEDQTIRKSIMNIKAGKTGYVWVIGTKKDMKGKYIISQNGKRDGELVLNMKEPNGSFPIQDMIKKVHEVGDGKIILHNYGWKNATDKEIRQKIAAVIYFEPWDWMIGVSAYEDEFYGSIDYFKSSMISLNNIILIGGFIIIIFIGFFSFYSGKQIVNPIIEIANASQSISEGNLNVNVEIRSKDEIGKMAESFKAMISTQNDLINTVNSLIISTKKGNLEQRADSSIFKGDFKKVIIGINSLLDSLITPLNVSSHHLNLISRGEIPEKIQDEYHGDFNEIKSSINLLIDTLNNFISDSKSMLDEHKLGDLDAQIPTSHFQGVYFEMATGFNDVVNLHVTNILNILSILSSYSEGDLTPTLAKLPGKQKLANDIVDQIKNNLLSIIEEINSLINASIDGDISKRGDVEKFKGAYKEIIVGFNRMLDSVEVPLTNIEQILKRIELNDFTQRIDKDYQGVWNVMKTSTNLVIDNLVSIQNIAQDMSVGNLSKLDSLKIEKININNKLTPSFISMMESINRLLSDVNHLSKAAVDGNLSERIDNSYHSGNYKELVNGINETIDKLIEPINEAGIVLDQLGKGDLTVKMIGAYKGDNQNLKNSVNILVESFHQLVTELFEATDLLVTSSNEIFTATEIISRNSDHQSSQITEVAAAMDELSKTITENARSTTFTASSANNNGNIAEQGGLVVKDTIMKMSEIAKTVHQSSEKINDLGQSSRKINEIIEVIDDIADQTNLLALNAAIEAARAGEQGRGFAVVADEVRKLAERTSLATKEIAKMIRSIQNETIDAVKVMEKGSIEVNDGIAYADKAGLSLSEIVESSKEVMKLIHQIASATEEQSATSEEITKVIESITSAINSTTDNIKQIESFSQNLTDLTGHLKNIMSRFHLDLSSKNTKNKTLEIELKNRKTIGKNKNFLLS